MTDAALFPNPEATERNLPSLPASMTFEEVAGRDADALRREALDAPMAAVARGMPTHHDPSATDDAGGAFVGRVRGKLVLLAPRLKRPVALPIRLGEKVLWRVRIPAARLLPSAQHGVTCEAHARALLTWLKARSPHQAVVLTDVMTDTPLYAALSHARAIGYRLTNDQPAPHLLHTFGDSYDAFFQAKPSKYKNQLRKKEKVFRERFGTAFSMKEYRSAADVPEFLNAAASINRATYQFKLFGERVDNDAAAQQAYAELARAGSFRSFVLWHEQTPLCFVLGQQGPDRVFMHQQTGFSPEWRDVAPGINCNIQLLQTLYTNDRPTVLDFGSGDADYKRLFANTTRASSSPVLIPKSLRYVLPYLLYAGLAHANEAAVGLLDRMGVKDALKRLLRRLP